MRFFQQGCAANHGAFSHPFGDPDHASGNNGAAPSQDSPFSRRFDCDRWRASQARKRDIPGGSLPAEDNKWETRKRGAASSIARAHDPADTHSRSFPAQSPFHKDPDDAAFMGLEEQEKAQDNKHVMFDSCHHGFWGLWNEGDGMRPTGSFTPQQSPEALSPAVATKRDRIHQFAICGDWPSGVPCPFSA